VSNDARAIAVIAVIAVAPLAICIIIALLRGYRIEVYLRRDKGNKGGE
jgi:hypothetical protein